MDIRKVFASPSLTLSTDPSLLSAAVGTAPALPPRGGTVSVGTSLVSYDSNIVEGR